mmetsp:Transcript_17217/g.37161  ORF Transcript_17217/g.37161 Transcript_17217/m.37161 type:complete len:99 (-) Transcript_17217:704-1000(-)
MKVWTLPDSSLLKLCPIILNNSSSIPKRPNQKLFCYDSRDGVSFEDGFRNPPLVLLLDEARDFLASLLLAAADDDPSSFEPGLTSSPLPELGILGMET